MNTLQRGFFKNLSTMSKVETLSLSVEITDVITYRLVFFHLYSRLMSHFFLFTKFLSTFLFLNELSGPPDFKVNDIKLLNDHNKKFLERS